MVISDKAQLPMLPAGIPWIKVSEPTSAAEPFLARQLNPHRPDVVFSPMPDLRLRGPGVRTDLTLHTT